MWNIGKIISKGDYNYCVVKEHPKSVSCGYVLHHRVIMENYLGRLLDANEIVHHKNENKKDNRLENLVLMNAHDHNIMHSTKGRSMVTLKCPSCKTLFDREIRQTHLRKGGLFSCCSRICNGKFSRYVQLQGRTHEVEAAISGNIVREFNSLDNPEEIV